MSLFNLDVEAAQADLLRECLRANPAMREHILNKVKAQLEADGVIEECWTAPAGFYEQLWGVTDVWPADTVFTIQERTVFVPINDYAEELARIPAERREAMERRVKQAFANAFRAE